jgi:hypothetical protein
MQVSCFLFMSWFGHILIILDTGSWEIALPEKPAYFHMIRHIS